MNTTQTETNLTLIQGQRIITTETKRTGIINLLPYNVTKENNYPAFIYFDDGSAGWVRPSHLRNYSTN